MSKECGVKAGSVRGKYNSKYKTEEEKIIARRERQKRYYERKKSATSKAANNKPAKEKLMKQVEVLTNENNLLRDELAYYKSINQSKSSSKIIVKEDKESFDDEFSDQYFSGNEKSKAEYVETIEKKTFSEEEIKKYEKARNKNTKNFKYDWDIEEIIAHRNRDIVD